MDEHNVIIKYGDISDITECTDGSRIARLRNDDKQIIIKKEDNINEIEVLRSIRHTNVVEFFGLFRENDDDDSNEVVLEYLSKGDLYHILHPDEGSSTTITTSLVFQYLHGIIKGIDYLHNEAPKSIIHRNLKSSTIYISENDVAKIGDFSISRFYRNTVYMTQHVSPRWAAPEIIKNEPISQSADIWSLGVVIWEIVTKQLPYKNITNHCKICNQIRKYKHPKYTCLPRFVHEILKNCFVPSSRKRWNIQNIRDYWNQNIQSDLSKFEQELEEFWSNEAVWLRNLFDEAEDIELVSSNPELVSTMFLKDEAVKKNKLIEICDELADEIDEKDLLATICGNLDKQRDIYKIPRGKLLRIKSGDALIKLLETRLHFDVNDVDIFIKVICDLPQLLPYKEKFEDYNRTYINFEIPENAIKLSISSSTVNPEKRVDALSRSIFSSIGDNKANVEILPLDSEVKYLEDKIGDQWRRFARNLQLKESFIRQLEENNLDYRKRTRLLLKEWIETNADNISREKLVSALDKSGLKMLAHRITQLNFSLSY